MAAATEEAAPAPAEAPAEEEEPKLSTVDDYETKEGLVEALAKTKLEEWKLPIFDVKNSDADPNDVDREARRLMVLKSYSILGSTEETEFDEITKEAQAYFKVPVAVVSLVDVGRQWFKSIQGLPVSETPRCISFCQHVVKRKERLGPMVVEDATKDDRFKDNPLVTAEPHVTFYAGAPLVTPEGEILGSFCIIDFATRKMTVPEIRRLEAFAQEVVFLMITRLPSRQINV